jgi:hypothetical protein
VGAGNSFLKMSLYYGTIKLHAMFILFPCVFDKQIKEILILLTIT